MAVLRKQWVLLFALLACVSAALAEPVDSYFPQLPVRLPGRTVGVLCTDGALQNHLGKGARYFSCTFSSAHSPYLWVWMPGPGKNAPVLTGYVGPRRGSGRRFQDGQGRGVLLQNLHVPDKGEVGPHVYQLVSVSINEGLGSLEAEAVALGQLQVLDGTVGYPADTSAVVAEAEAAAAKTVAACLERASRSSDTPVSPKGLTMSAYGPKDGAVSYVTWLPDSNSLEIRCRQMAQRVRHTQIGTRRFLVHPKMPFFDPYPGWNGIRPSPPPPHWETLPRMRTTTYGTAVDVTFLWHTGRLVQQNAAPHLYSYHEDEPESSSDDRPWR